MGNDSFVPRRPDRGFSIIELLTVVAIVAIMAAVFFPNIVRYARDYKIKGAAQQVAGELQAARSKAIMTNTNSGVSLVVVDRDSYRFVQEDITDTTDPQRLGGMRTLPEGVIFKTSTLADKGPTLRFLRLGGFCNPAATSGTCAPAVPVADRTKASEASMIDAATQNGNYFGRDATGTIEIRLQELGRAVSLERTVRIAQGGRVLAQP